MMSAGIMYFLAWTRLSKKAVCEMSKTGIEFHDYPDSEEGVPIHFHTYRCVRCNKAFMI